MDWRLLIKDFCGFLQFQWFFSLNFCVVFGSLQTSLLCIMGESAGEGSVAVAVGVSDRWHVTHDKCNVKRDMWHLTHGTPFCFSFPFLSVSTVVVSELLSPHVERFSVSHIQDFCHSNNQKFTPSNKDKVCQWTFYLFGLLCYPQSTLYQPILASELLFTLWYLPLSSIDHPNQRYC